MPLSMRILKRSVVFPPAPHEICKWDQKIPFFHDERTNLLSGHSGSIAHSGT